MKQEDAVDYNDCGKKIGVLVENNLRQFPCVSVLDGSYCTVSLLQIEKQAEELFDAYAKAIDDTNWTYLPYGPFKNVDTYRQWLHDCCQSNDPLFYAIKDKQTNLVLGVVSYLNIFPVRGVIEIGHINFAPQLKKTIAATEAIYLMLKHVFQDLGYRRCEWRCNHLNETSRTAAVRYGFTFEGVLRQHDVVKGRNRDTAVYSIIDNEWVELATIFEKWLSEDNFDENKHQRESLREIRTAINITEV